MSSLPALHTAVPMIPDSTLDAIDTVSRKALTVGLDDADATLLLHHMHALVAELIQRRRAAAVIRDLTDPCIVQIYPGAAA